MTSPIIVAGGGLAGAAAAAGLARAGLDVTLIERENGPADKICGEFLSSEAIDYLRKLGLDPASLGGQPISALCLVRGGKQIHARLPFAGLGISRRVLDEAVLNHAVRCGSKLLRGHRVTSVSTERGLSVDIAGIRQITTETLLLATGKHEVRGYRRNAELRNDLVGFKMYFRLTAEAERRIAGKVALILSPSGYAGFQLVEGGKANLCLLIARAHLQSIGGAWPGLLADLRAQSSYLDQMLTGSEPLLDKPLTIFRVPYGHVHLSRPTDPVGIYRLGDQAAVIPSFTGDGMAIALHTAALAVSAVLAGESANIYHKRLSNDLAGQIKRASQLYSLVQNSLAQPIIFELAKLWPAGLGLAASLTRVPLRARV